jgi:hypothetical protein
MVMGVPVNKIIEHIGHDGSEVVFPDLPFPICYAGFSLSEIIDVAILQYGWSVTNIVARPTLTNDGKETRELFSEDKIKTRMDHYFDLFSGIVAGYRRDGRWYHNVAWDHVSQQWFDPSGPVLPRATAPIDIAEFWIFQKTDRYVSGEYLQQVSINSPNTP